MTTMTDVHCRIQEVIRKAIDLYHVLPLRNVRIEFYNSGTSHGTCKYSSTKGYTLRFNVQTLSKGASHLMDNTIPHEIAHAVHHMLYGKLNHDRNWRRICLSLGGNAERCSNVGLEKVRNVKRWKYRATCGTEIELTTARHKSVQSGHNCKVRRTGGLITASCWLGEVRGVKG